MLHTVETWALAILVRLEAINLVNQRQPTVNNTWKKRCTYDGHVTTADTEKERFRT